MTDTPRLWDRRADETPKSYAAFRAYVALGARRSVREAAPQNHIKTTALRRISWAASGMPNTQTKPRYGRARFNSASGSFTKSSPTRSR